MKTLSISCESYTTSLLSEVGIGTSVDIDYEFISSPIYNEEKYHLSDSDSEFDHESTLNSSLFSTHTSLKSFVTAYPINHGRRYHAFKAGIYLIPNDQKEQERLDLSHIIWKVMLGGLCSDTVTQSLGLSSNRNPFVLVGMIPRERVLDLGTGTGAWAIDFADEHADAGMQVIGNDLSGIQPQWIPPNCSFVIDDFEAQSWSYQPHEAFDLIRGRALAGSVSSWSSFLSNTFTHLNPGGWIEIQECEFDFFSDADPFLNECPTLRNGVRLMKQGFAKVGKRIDVVADVEKWMRDAGFVDVAKEVTHVPIGTWAGLDANDEVLRDVGYLHCENMVDAVEAFGLAVFTQVLGWSLRDTRKFLGRVQMQLKRRELRLYSRFHVFYGRKAV